MKLQGRVAVITGASSGIGAAAAQLLAREGATVVLAARRPELLDRLAVEIADHGGQAVSIPTDVTDAHQVNRLIDVVIGTLGHIDIVLNSAGTTVKVAPLEQFSDDDFRQVIDTNLVGAFHVARAVVPHMKRRHRGTIINIGSRVGKVAVANIAPFCAAKFALDGMAQALAQELRPYDVYVTTLVLGMTNTDIRPLNPNEAFRRQLINAQDVAEVVLWACTLPSSLRVDEIPVMPRHVDF